MVLKTKLNKKTLKFYNLLEKCMLKQNLCTQTSIIFIFVNSTIKLKTTCIACLNQN